MEALTAEVVELRRVADQSKEEMRRTANAVNGNPEAPLLVEMA